ncbi:LysR family transcriptional regulator [Streptomyces antimycoticus]|uniref:LysR family transcriptional regulator n=2 Tax=Streptomyces violaceusniger group TaxID=2839105 RepID=A0ABD5J3E4_9ACTN|nr:MULTISPECIES: LysR family transcriptional regulator [Streptomyces]MEE4582751.1 LysR family transcriptional regulator [Streptomyces sp. DSM 41602]KUL47466.1 LysR family transcriptional regulator [Streptomyces violaceusniger]QTI90102.1 LysR family transcriptional regulator [Streptomyces sp. AgN23]RSS49423.1 LysR family transcriptional regulator [Streptomyces sp. WAC05858]WJD95079.1 LysR family transcriptional regulator [Streptomyces antimycoticus]
MESQLSLRRLEVFCLVVEEGSVTRAAERLRVAQPAVSSQLRALEQWIGARLFVRTSGRMVLTEAGGRAHLWAREMLARCLQVRRDVEELTLGTGGSVVLASSLAVGTYLLPPLMTALRAERPGADITVHVAQPEHALHAVEIGEVDFAVMTRDERALPTSIVAETLLDEPLILCASPDGPPTANSVSLSALPKLPIVGVPRQVAFQRSIDTQLQELGVGELDTVIRLGHAEAIKTAVIEHGWAAIFPRYSVERDLAEGRLRAIEFTDGALYERIGLFYRTDKYFSPLQASALDAIRLAGR